MDERPPTKSHRGGHGVWNAVSFALELGFSISLPIVFFALGGRLLDRALDTKPIFFLVGIPLAIIVSLITVAEKARVILSRSEQTSTPSDPTGLGDESVQ